MGGGACLPDVPPGLKIWTAGDAQSICALGNSKCVVTYGKKLLGGKDCVDNCECLEPSYAQKMNEVCTGLGDCGAYVNIAGKYTDGGAEWKIKGRKMTIGNAFLSEVKKKAGAKLTGYAVDETESEKTGLFGIIDVLLAKITGGSKLKL